MTIRKRIGKLANKLGFYSADQLRSAVGFAAAKATRLTNSWTTQTLSADSTLRNDLEKLRARARDLKQNGPWAEKWVSMLKTNVLSHAGMMMKNMARDPGKVVGNVLQPGQLDVFANKQIEDAWKEWGKADNCTTGRNLTWQEVNEVCLETAATDGEVLAAWTNHDNPFRFALRLWESDHLDIGLNKQLRNGNEIRMGVELTPMGERVRYWLRGRNPNDSYYGGEVVGRYTPIEANRVIHPYLMRRIGQTRGYPWMAPVMDRTNMLEGYEEAEVVRARTGAAKHGFLKRTGDASYRGPDDGSGNKYMDVEPGSWDVLPEGLDPVAFDWDSPNSQFDAFEKRMLRGIAAGLLTGYNVLADDMESVNFSSARIGLMEPREVYKMLQRWWANKFCAPTFTAWLTEQLQHQNVVKGLRLEALDKYDKPQWRGRRWQYIEPVKEVQAAQMRMDSKLSSLSIELAELGWDRDELLDIIADDKAALEARGLSDVDVVAVAGGTGGDDDVEPTEQTDDSEEMKKQADAYGVAVRAGAITPTEDDENYFREKLGVKATAAVKQAWVEDAGFRRPITLLQKSGNQPAVPSTQPGAPSKQEGKDDDQED